MSVHAAKHDEVKLVQRCFDFYRIEAAEPENLMGDRAYDREELDEGLREDGVEVCASSEESKEKDDARWKAASSLQKKVAGGAILDGLSGVVD